MHLVKPPKPKGTIRKGRKTPLPIFKPGRIPYPFGFWGAVRKLDIYAKVAGKISMADARSLLMALKQADDAAFNTGKLQTGCKLRDGKPLGSVPAYLQKISCLTKGPFKKAKDILVAAGLLTTEKGKGETVYKLLWHKKSSAQFDANRSELVSNRGQPVSPRSNTQFESTDIETTELNRTEEALTVNEVKAQKLGNTGAGARVTNAVIAQANTGNTRVEQCSTNERHIEWLDRDLLKTQLSKDCGLSAYPLHILQKVYDDIDAQFGFQGVKYRTFVKRCWDLIKAGNFPQSPATAQPSYPSVLGPPLTEGLKL